MAQRASFERGWFARQLLELVDKDPPPFESSLEKHIDRDAIRAYATRMKDRIEAEERAARASSTSDDAEAADLSPDR
ncbi:hypothetical protein [Salinarimonas ramus]|uniref:Uncharacterized protein n=1 Tax=Salinarimonas ramus TaxID=690164 RepID=A0A917V346_9HYPH|nr:hypothetical protein [Salinarimonas ramus]GGK33042.1 hypothetical protein GCM10011322_19710 [Salinarimonas ramus]